MKENKKEFEDMTLDELYEIAKEKNIPKKSEMNKEQLIKALKGQHQDKNEGKSHRPSHHGHKNPSDPGQGGGEGDTPAPKGVNPKDYNKIPGNQS